MYWSIWSYINFVAFPIKGATLQLIIHDVSAISVPYSMTLIFLALYSYINSYIHKHMQSLVQSLHHLGIRSGIFFWDQLRSLAIIMKNYISATNDTTGGTLSCYFLAFNWLPHAVVWLFWWQMQSRNLHPKEPISNGKSCIYRIVGNLRGRKVSRIGEECSYSYMYCGSTAFVGVGW